VYNTVYFNTSLGHWEQGCSDVHVGMRLLRRVHGNEAAQTCTWERGCSDVYMGTRLLRRAHGNEAAQTCTWEWG